MYKLYKSRKKYSFKESFDFLSFPLVINNYEILIGNENIFKKIFKYNIKEDFDKLIIKALHIIEDGNNEEDSILILEQLSSYHNLIFNVYSTYFTKAELNKYGRNIRLLVSELKKIKLKQKEIVSTSHRRR